MTFLVKHHGSGRDGASFARRRHGGSLVLTSGLLGGIFVAAALDQTAQALGRPRR